jgi:hypothetical protein
MIPRRTDIENPQGFETFGDAIKLTSAGEAFPAPVPEPSAIALQLTTLGVLGWLARRRSRSKDFDDSGKQFNDPLASSLSSTQMNPAGQATPLSAGS